MSGMPPPLRRTVTTSSIPTKTTKSTTQTHPPSSTSASTSSSSSTSSHPNPHAHPHSTAPKLVGKAAFRSQLLQTQIDKISSESAESNANGTSHGNVETTVAVKLQRRNSKISTESENANHHNAAGSVVKISTTSTTSSHTELDSTTHPAPAHSTSSATSKSTVPATSMGKSMLKHPSSSSSSSSTTSSGIKKPLSVKTNPIHNEKKTSTPSLPHSSHTPQSSSPASSPKSASSRASASHFSSTAPIASRPPGLPRPKSMMPKPQTKVGTNASSSSSTSSPPSPSHSTQQAPAATATAASSSSSSSSSSTTTTTSTSTPIRTKAPPLLSSKSMIPSTATGKTSSPTPPSHLQKPKPIPTSSPSKLPKPQSRPSTSASSTAVNHHNEASHTSSNNHLSSHSSPSDSPTDDDDTDTLSSLHAPREISHSVSDINRRGSVDAEEYHAPEPDLDALKALLSSVVQHREKETEKKTSDHSNTESIPVIASPSLHISSIQIDRVKSENPMDSPLSSSEGFQIPKSASFSSTTTTTGSDGDNTTHNGLPLSSSFGSLPLSSSSNSITSSSSSAPPLRRPASSLILGAGIASRMRAFSNSNRNGLPPISSSQSNSKNPTPDGSPRNSFAMNNNNLTLDSNGLSSLNRLDNSALDSLSRPSFTSSLDQVAKSRTSLVPLSVSQLDSIRTKWSAEKMRTDCHELFDWLRNVTKHKLDHFVSKHKRKFSIEADKIHAYQMKIAEEKEKEKQSKETESNDNNGNSVDDSSFSSSISPISPSSSSSSSDDIPDELIQKSLFDSLQTGELLCVLCNSCDPSVSLRPTPSAAPGSFQARDNISKFLQCATQWGMKSSRLFETDDLALRKNDRSVLNALLDLAKHVYLKFGVEPPAIVKMEMEVEELEKEEMKKEQDGGGNAEREREQKFIEEQERERNRRQSQKLDNGDGEDNDENDGNDKDKQKKKKKKTKNGAADDEENDEDKDSSSLSPTSPPPSISPTPPSHLVTEIVSSTRYKARWLPYIPFKGDKVDEAVAELLNGHGLDVYVKRMAVGQYYIGDPKVNYVRLVRRLVLVRVGGGWEGFVDVAMRKMGFEEELVVTTKTTLITQQL